MTRQTIIQICAILLVGAATAFGVLSAKPDHASDGEDAHAGEGESHDDTQEGPHGGRLFQADGLRAEISIFEDGTSPQWRVYAQLEDTLLPDTAKARIQTRRLGGALETFELSRTGDYWSSAQVVAEPHSFDVTLVVEYADKTTEWSYAQYEGRTEIVDGVLAEMGVRILPAANCNIVPSMRISGLVVSDPQRTAHLSARYDGMVRRVNTHIGDRVRKGETLAQIEGNESLATYNVSSSLSGVVTDMHIALSESVGPDQILFTVADLSRVWVELAVPVSRAKALKPGASIEIHLPDGTSLPAKIAHVAPTVNMASQSVEAHAEIDNREGLLRPGTFVDIDLTTSAKAASLCVAQAAIQSMGDSTVVFVRHGNSIEARPVALGIRDAKHVEILSGLAPEESYVAEGSFLIKADILKSGASHEH